MSRPPIVLRVKTLEMPISDDPAVLRQERDYIKRYGVMPAHARLAQLDAALRTATNSPRPTASGQPKHMKEHG